jgi:hypothetical protein
MRPLILPSHHCHYHISPCPNGPVTISKHAPLKTPSTRKLRCAHVRCRASQVEPLREDSVRTQAIKIIEKPDDIFKYENVTTHAALFKAWLETGKIATWRPVGPHHFRLYEGDSIHSAYQYGISLGRAELASRFRNAVVDAMAEFLDDYGRLGDWPTTANASLDGDGCPMWRSDCFFMALSTGPLHYQHLGPSSTERRISVDGDSELNACWRDQLREVKAVGRTYRKI